MMRIGIGYDIHRLIDCPENNNINDHFIKICGIQIQSKQNIVAHSDGDVGLHALTDALLGAIGDQDIGHYFPSDNEQFRNMDSAIILKKINQIIQYKKCIINNIDIIIICQNIRLSHYRTKMKDRVAQILDAMPNQIGVKFKTKDYVGEVGKGEAIESYVVALLECPN